MRLWKLLEDLKKKCPCGCGHCGEGKGQGIEGPRRPLGPNACTRIPRRVLRRPDPMIYSQRYLMSQGLAVTWQNPDVRLELGGVPVDSSALAPDTVYDVIARVWNTSVEAPAVGLPVRFSYLDFGIGTVRVPIGETRVDLGVKGSTACPVYALQKWRTPKTPGHYCLQIELIWDDDANPQNNLGQHNTNVKKLNSPHAAFTFPVRNEAGAPRLLRLEADTYRPPPRPRCTGGPRTSAIPSVEELARMRREAVAGNSRDRFPVRPGWRVELSPRELQLAPGESRNVTVDITAPDGFSGTEIINVNALDGLALAGGVTLRVHD